MSVYTDFLDLLDVAIEKAGNANRLAEALGIMPNLISRWKNKQRIPTLESIQPVIDYLGVTWTSVEQDKAQQAVEPTAEVLPNQEREEYRQRIAQLEKQVRELEQYKFKWEGHLETERARSGFVSNERRFSA